MSENRKEAPSGRDDAAMADILASIRRIVAEGDPAQRAAAEQAGEVLVLTEAMRLDRAAAPAAPEEAPVTPPSPPPEPSPVDEAQMAEIARDVLQRELKGDLGKLLTRNLRLLVREEVARALSERGGDAG